MKEKVKLQLIAAMAFIAFSIVLVSADTDASAESWDVNADTTWYGDGSDTDYTIATAEQLAGLAELVNNEKTFKDQTIVLTDDISLKGSEWVPIGNGVRNGSAYTGNSFKGTFDGNGHTISGLTITNTSGADHALGLFGVVDAGEVKNLVLKDVNINVSNSEIAGGAVGCLVEGGVVDSIEVYGSIEAGRGNGGIVGRMMIEGTISNCTNNADVVGLGTGNNVGGIIGAAYYTGVGKNMLITDCTNNGVVQSDTEGAIGGIAGLSSALIYNCINNADITGNDVDVAGIVGEQQNYGVVANCTNYGDITNKSKGYGTGGIVGWIRYNGSESNYPLKVIIEVRDNINLGSISGGNDAGGIVGTCYNHGIIKNNINLAKELKSSNFVAGIVANAQFTETAVGISGSDMVYVEDNISTTLSQYMEGSCKAPYCYVNNSEKVTMENNIQELPPDFKLPTTGGPAIDIPESVIKDIIDSNPSDPVVEIDNASSGSVVIGSSTVATIKTEGASLKIALTVDGSKSEISLPGSILMNLTGDLTVRVQGAVAPVGYTDLPSGTSVFEIELLNGSENVGDLGGYATVMLPFSISGGEDISDYEVWYLGDIVEKFEIDDYSEGGVWFSTNHFSPYAIVNTSQMSDTTIPTVPDDDDELPFIPPQSGDDNGADTTTYVAVAAAAAVVAILAVLAVGISKGKL